MWIHGKFVEATGAEQPGDKVTSNWSDPPVEANVLEAINKSGWQALV
jgi:hypothetical protein